MSDVLSRLVQELAAGTVRVVDLTQPLGPDTPVIGLPPIFAASPGVTIDVISRYDERGPALVLEHADVRRAHRHALRRARPLDHAARICRDNACDTIPARRFVGPACVIDVSARGRARSRLPADGRRASSAGKRRTAGFRRAPGCCCARGWSRRTDPAAFLNVARRRPAQPGLRRGDVARARARPRRPRRRRRDDRHRRRPGRPVRSAVSEPRDHARRRQVRPREPVPSRSSSRRPAPSSSPRR